MARIKTTYAARIVRHQRLRQTLSGTAERPRLNVFRSSRHMYVQVIDDVAGHIGDQADEIGAGKQLLKTMPVALEMERVERIPHCLIVRV